jgi:4'-phosphopantetheinyl transferase
MNGGAPRVDLWIMHTGMIDAKLHDRLLARLNERERAHHDRHAKPQDRLHHAAAHALKRHALSARFDGAPSKWEFTENPYGKPRLSNGPNSTDPHFNLTHTSGLVAVAVSNGLDLGLDAEALDPDHVSLDTAMAFAHSSELRGLDPASPHFVHNFYRLWTRKEVLAKATGLGLSLDVRTLVFADEIDGQWHLHEWDEDADHHLALIATLKYGPPEIVEHRVRAADIL